MGDQGLPAQVGRSQDYGGLNETAPQNTDPELRPRTEVRQSQGTRPHSISQAGLADVLGAAQEGQGMKQLKPWKRAVDLAQKCKSGKRLCCFNQPSEECGNQVVFFLEPGGYPVGRKTAENAIQHGLLVPANDGLFGAEFSQTWSAT